MFVYLFTYKVYNYLNLFCKFINKSSKMSLEEIRICRFCLTDKEPLINIFEESTGNSLLLKAIYVLSIQVLVPDVIFSRQKIKEGNFVLFQIYPGDNKPKFSCKICSELIIFFNSFKTNCFTSERILDIYPCFPFKKLDHLNIQALQRVSFSIKLF